ncbi:hypothetical protein I5Q34_13535 [Streptomyces sp. AV19]|uniref:hypothetical protein n=1 Tax=Streptomyces sp. AV19 TaxID=2793068 RepID=UPI0018FE74AA|nr:hypothetical protein [Streptomyces sp. AV19]MBH1935282.1 hypothetical protein [Streptomyces sp. AV19]MDG4531168.1 hypothetical protein [Streptomyces sp. AV19]
MRVGITGHRGLSSEVEAVVRRMLDEAVFAYAPDALIGVSCIADGPDAWFGQSVLRQGGRLEVVIPAEEYRDRLPDWHHPTYDHLLGHATKVHRTGRVVSDSHAHMAGSELLVGLVDALIAVWDGQPPRGYGGTADVVAHAHVVGIPVHVLWPEGAARD